MESVDRLEELKRDLAEVIQEKFIDEWLQKPNGAFDGRTPIDLIQSGESLRIRKMIHELRSGQPR
ncbi:hypothetical protein A2635_00695 [Candidatus Peribacteria bacterium RIFCSPHIGHO2_01_FULL_51_9]|nr:MAG: hypothetical protein A2635_00695 [Candidatus Peribacteria bacterium RIFCSPHIGHO2_01_FULL_51_9]